MNSATTNRPRVFLWLDRACAIVNVAASWDVAWNSLLSGYRHFIPPTSIFTTWPPGPPAAIISNWGIGGPPPLDMRGQLLAFRIANALRDSTDLLHGLVDKKRIGVVIATSHGESGAVTRVADGDYPKTPEFGRILLTEDFRAAVIDGLGCSFPTSVIAAACASGMVASGYARDLILIGLLDACVVVSVDPMSRAAYTGFRRIGAMSNDGCRPFDVTRDGTTVGEGACGFILLSEDIASTLQGTVEIGGFGVGCDARHPVEPDAGGIVSSIQKAIGEACIDINTISAVVWHGTGTIQNDAAEAKAASVLFGDDCPPGTSIKGSFGHTMGVSAGLNLLAACEIRQRKILPPVAGLISNAFPWLNVNPETRRIYDGPVLSVSLGFGGISAATIIL